MLGDREQPIGVFDSGLGGLTVLSSLIEALPSERFLYLADQAHLPYGDHPLTTIQGYAESISDHLIRRGVKAVVMACNISSVTAGPKLEARYGSSRAFSMIEPGAQAALQAAGPDPKAIGVLATTGTAKSKAYSQALQRASQGTQVIEVACPKFVPLVESGLSHSEAAVEAAKVYLQPILAAGAETVILGCTHYPFLAETLQKAAAELKRAMGLSTGQVTDPSTPLQLIDPAKAVTDRVARELAAADRLRAGDPKAPECLTTGDPAVFSAQLKALGFEAAEVKAISWQSALD